MQKVISATRLHLPLDTTEIPKATQEHLCTYAQNVKRLGLVAAIAVNSLEAEVKQLAESAAPGVELHVLPVPCWGAFVPALNALLEFAQRKGMKYILYQSLEMQCSQSVLTQLLDHFNSNVLVVGPVLAGHTFQAGEQTLNGRTTPWNTLALWSVRKLALTGFPHIADGLVRQSSPLEDPPQQEASDSNALFPCLLGSKGWWSSSSSEELGIREDVPAGVEEVTTIALLQHLLGRHKAIAVLLQLPENIVQGISWQASWELDERRKKWHEYKMKSKVTRPHAQLQELFNIRRNSCSLRSADTGDLEEPAGSLNLGTVMHFGPTISPSPSLQRICFLAVGIFYFNSTAVLAEAFHCINQSSWGNFSLSTRIAFAGLVIGGVYILMPISLQLTRMLTRRFDHAAGFLFFGSILLLSHLCIIASQLWCSEPTQRAVLLAARLAQGLGSGVPFQSRFVLASMSTANLHTKMQARAFFSGDLGLGLGALLPAAVWWLAGRSTPHQDMLWPSTAHALICAAFLVCVLLCFPRHLHMLPDRVRFAGYPSEAPVVDKSEMLDDGRGEAAKFRVALLASGTLRVFVQSAIIPVVALLMHDANLTGYFRQSIAVAMIFLLQLPFEALASRMCCMCDKRFPSKHGLANFASNRVLLGSSILALLFVNVAMGRMAFHEDEKINILCRRFAEIVGLLVALAIASPFNASRLYQLEDAERAIVILEWMKAYIGRLIGPFIAVVVYTQVGYGPLLAILCSATIVVTLTA